MQLVLRRGGRKNANKQRKQPKAKLNQSNRLHIIREPGRFMPDRIIRNLVYNDTTFYRSHVGSTAINWYYRSSAYDPDPALGTGAIPGFAELANMYKAYLVRSMTLKTTVQNQNGDGAIIGIWPSNTLLNSNSLAPSDIIEYSSNPNSARGVLNNNNGGSKTFSCTATGSHFYGRQFMNDLTFTGSTGGNPGTMYGINVGILDGTASNFGFGFVMQTQIIYEVEFFELIQLQS